MLCLMVVIRVLKHSINHVIEAMRLLREEYGLPIDFYHVPGIHDWTFWRKALVRFMGKVFH